MKIKTFIKKLLLSRDTSTLKKCPLVSVGLTVFNADKFLKKTLDSLLAQSYKNIEIIISDNASTDSSRDICLEYASKDKRIKYHRNIKNLGPVANFNQTFTLSSGEYFMWAADHDMWDPSYVEKCLAVLRDDPSVALCYTKTILIDEAGNHIKHTPDILDTRELNAVDRIKKVMWGLEWCNMIYGLFRSSTLQKTELSRTVLGTDHVLLAEISLHGSIAQLAVPLFYRRENRPNETAQQAEERHISYLLDPKKCLFGYMIPWTLMGYEHLIVIRDSALTIDEKEALLCEVVKCCITRFGSLIKKEITAFIDKGLKMLSNHQDSKYTCNLYALELMRLSYIVKILLPHYQRLDILRAHCMISLGLMKEAESALKEEIISFPDSEEAKDMLEKIFKQKNSNSV